MRNIFFLFLFLSVRFSAQINEKPLQPLVKDPFFVEKNEINMKVPSEKVHIIHTDEIKKDPDKYEANTYFQGNVQIEHKGSTLFADIVIYYESENFVKALGHVRLQNADGSVINADEMEYDGNTQKGIARNNVVLTDPKQTIKTQTLYYDRVSNRAYFNTGGTIYANNSVTYAKTATYFANTRVVNLSSNIKMDNNQYTLEGTTITQNQITNTAEFSGPTTITNKKNPSNRVYTENGKYNMNTDEVYLNKNSKIFYNGKVLTADKMYFNQNSGFGKGDGNVLLRDPEEKRFVKGDYGEIYQKKDSAMVSGHAYAVKMLEKDSMYFSAEKIITFQKTDSLLKKKSYLRAYKKGRFFKTNAQARADSISFNETDGVLHLFGKPLLWSGTKQVSGDKIEAYFDTENEYIDSLKVIGNAFAISKADSLNLKDEFNQVKGKLMSVYYDQNEVKLAKVIGNAQSITYADDTNEKTKNVERIGVALSSCGIIEAEFVKQRVDIISCNVGSQTDVYPMSKISKKERFFPDFNWNTKDRLKKWQDIFLDTPNYEEIQYTSDDTLYNAAQNEIDKAKAAQEAKKPKRIKKE